LDFQDYLVAMKILIKVECQEGEEGTWLSDITESEANLILPLIQDIYHCGGFFPPGAQTYQGYTELLNRLPSPPSGFEKINEIYVFSDALFSLIM